MAHSLDQVQALYFKTKAERDELAKRHAAEAKTYDERIDICKAWMLDYLNRNGLENARTEHGTCYKNTATSVTVDQEGGWEKLLDFIIHPAIVRFAEVMENGGTEQQAALAAREAPELAFLNRVVNKTAVLERLEQHPEFNPAEIGVRMTSVVQLGVRKA